jgi:hypothetical protein
MRARLTAVVQHVFVFVTSVLKGIGKDGHSVEGFLFVDTFCKSKENGRQPIWVKRDGAEGVTEDVTNE